MKVSCRVKINLTLLITSSTSSLLDFVLLLYLLISNIGGGVLISLCIFASRVMTFKDLNDFDNMKTAERMEFIELTTLP